MVLNWGKTFVATGHPIFLQQLSGWAMTNLPSDKRFEFAKPFYLKGRRDIFRECTPHFSEV